jgi:V-type H+-transporting ATPase subunit F
MADRNKKKKKFQNREGGYLIGMIADEDTITGFLLSGVGDIDKGTKKKNFFVVTNKTQQQQVEEAFREMTHREDISIILITQTVAEDIRHILNDYKELIPTVLEIPSKDCPYEPEKDSIIQRIEKKVGRG